VNKKNEVKKLINNFYIVLFFFCSNYALFADPGDGSDLGNLEDTDPLGASINECLWVLVLMGLIFVFIKLKSYSRKMELSKNMIVLECIKGSN